MQANQNTRPSSNNFKLHLLEIAVLTVHSLAATLYTTSHPDINIYPKERLFTQHSHYAADLYHWLHRLATRYPYGLADVIGYWAETQIFGGVVLFEHENDQSEGALLSAFIHSPRKRYLLPFSSLLPTESSPPTTPPASVFRRPRRRHYHCPPQ